MTSSVEVVPLVRLGKAGGIYSYLAPDALKSSLIAGQIVAIPFRQRLVTGIVVDPNADTGLSGLRALESIEQERPVLLPHQIELASWIAKEYAAPLGDVLAGMLPPAIRRLRSTSTRSSSTTRFLVLTNAGRGALETPGFFSRSPVRRQIMELLVDGTKPLNEQDVLAGCGGSGKEPLKALIRSGLVNVEVDAGSPNESGDEAMVGIGTKKPILSEAQSTAAKRIIASLDRTDDLADVYLLHGVTGSGKTEVYMSVIAEVLSRGRQAIVMVPEISLTPQAIDRFAGRFPGMVAALHSRQSRRQRLSEWRRILHGKARIVVGPRSALFAPLGRLGVIVVDEEHDASYKQAESPRYHARDAAVWLGAHLRIPVVLGSATPDVGTYYAARKKRYILLSLPGRPRWQVSPDQTNGNSGDREMPAVEIVDLRQELRAGERGIFSRELRCAMEDNFSRGRQALLFLNRRGAATAVVCRDCGNVARCERCDIPLTYHSHASSLICHRCNRREPPPRTCPSCTGNRIRYLGVGTQRVVEEVQSVLPGARVLRWDRDVINASNDHAAVARAFAGHEADILVGTQMIAKGLDFPLVSLVGVVLADVGLHLPDFRASERAFQLMTQVAGRAGRAELPSRVIVQTYSPSHYALQSARTHDYFGFYQQEMAFRLESGYPPFGRLLRLVFRNRSASLAHRDAFTARERLTSRARALQLEHVDFLGPAPAFSARVNNVFQWHLVIRGNDLHSLLPDVPETAIVDVDPIDLL